MELEKLFFDLSGIALLIFAILLLFIICNINNHPFIKWLKSNPNIIVEWFAFLLIIIIANVFVWSTHGSVVGRLYGCTIVTIFSIGTFAYIKTRDM